MLKLWLVDDEPTEAVLMKAALKGTSNVQFRSEADAASMLSLLRSTPRKDRPDVLLVDINMPVMSGHDLVRELRADPALQDLIVVSFSNSSDRVDVQRMYDNHVAGYVVKPTGFHQLRETLQQLVAYWRDVVVTPQTSPA